MKVTESSETSDNPTQDVIVMDYLENSVFKSKAVIFDQLSFWLVVGVIVIFLAGTAFGRLTDSHQPDQSNVPSSVAHHHTVYGRFGSLHWDK